MLWFSIISFILCMGIFHIYPYFRKKSKLLSYVEKDEYFYIIVFFLIKEKAYKNFINNLKEKDLFEWYKMYYDTYIFSEAFNWNDTKQGYQYWFDLNKKWLNTYQYIHKDIPKNLIINYIKLEYRKL